MFNQIAISYPWWFVAACILLGLLYAAGLYVRDRNFTESGQVLNRLRWLFALLRFATVTIIALLLLSPVLRYKSTETEKPIILVAEDNSASIRLALDSQQLSTHQDLLHGQLQKLEQQFDVQRFHYGQSLERGPARQYDDQLTDLSAGLEDLHNLFLNRNIGAVVLSGDGIYNGGYDPLRIATTLNAPIYSIAMGDTSQRRDLKVTRVLHNHLVYLGDRFSIRVEVDAKKLNGLATRLLVERIDDSQTQQLYSTAVNIESDRWTHQFECLLEADRAGMQQYRIRLVPVNGEHTTANNYADAFVEVLDARRKVLLLAHAPHPDLTAIKQSLQRKSNYEVNLVLAKDFIGDELDYSLLILHNLPSGRHSMDALLRKAATNAVPILFVLGTGTDLSAFNKAQELINISGARGATNKVQGVVNDNFKLFTPQTDLREKLEDYPPLHAPFGDYTRSPETAALLNQQIGSVKTDMPLWVYGQYGQVRNAVLCAEGIWQWSLYNYKQEGNHELFDELIGKSVQYLAVKTDQRSFRVTADKQVYNENERVLFQAELYNATYEPVNEAEVSLKITDADGREYDHVFNRSAAYYALDAGSFAPGNYKYTANCSFGSEHYTQSGRFSVKALRLEALRIRADAGLMNELAVATGGALFFSDNIDHLADSITASGNIKPVLHSSTSNRSVINLKFLFFLLVGLLAMEWLFRKRSGAY